MQEILQTEIDKVAEGLSDKTQKLTDEQNALLVYQHHINAFIKKLDNFPGSRRQLIRAWINSAIYPMNKEELHFSYPEEEELFNMYSELNSAKFVLMMFGMVKEGKIQVLKPLLEERQKTASELQLEEIQKKSKELVKDALEVQEGKNG